MAAIKLAGFRGEQPRISPRLLPSTSARSAINARLDDGALSPFRKPVVEQSLEGGPFETIYRHNDVWLGFTGHVHAAPGPVADDRLYYTGDGVPKLRIGSDVYPLAVSRPTVAPTVTLGSSGSGDVITRAYVYTFVTAFGEESEPSPVSNEVAYQSGHTVTLSGIAAPPSGRNITKQRFYRTQTGQVGTDFYFIAERNASSSDFVDTAAIDAFAEPLPSKSWNVPPDTLQGLIALPNGIMAAFSGKRLYFSEPYRPHAWPESYVLTTDVPIVALAAMNTTIWVLTEGVPYRIVGTTPGSMIMSKVEANLPCINAKGVVDLGFAVAWPSNDGLAVARMDGSVGIATGNLFSPREWRRLNPGAMRAGQIEGRWVGSYAATSELGQPISGSLIIDLSDESFLIRTEIEADAWFYDVGNGIAYFLDGDRVLRFDPPDGDPAELYWRSKQFVLPKPDTFGCILAETGAAFSVEAVALREAEIAATIAANEILLASEDGVGGELAADTLAATLFAGDNLLPIPPSLGGRVTISVYADNKLVATIGALNQVKRLPAGFTARIWEIDAFSDVEIVQITMARTMDELKAAAGGV